MISGLLSLIYNCVNFSTVFSCFHFISLSPTGLIIFLSILCLGYYHELDFKKYLSCFFIFSNWKAIGFLALLLVTLWEILDRTGPVMMSADFPVCEAGGNVRWCLQPMGSKMTTQRVTYDI